MSRYSRRIPKESNAKISSSRNNSRQTQQAQSIPGTPIQQMWHILNFHETRLTQLSQFLQQQESNAGNEKAGENAQVVPSDTEHMIQYNTLLQQVQELTDRVEKLEAENKQLSQGNMVSLSIEEDLQNGFNGESAV
tara:strand:+ start:2469 stop:2876 length:408 start_codon:yes stop_codon:yes gene_type:complete